VWRAIAVLAAAALLLEPNLVAVKRETARPHDPAVDTSQSMNRSSVPARVGAAAGRRLREIGVADPAATTRLDLVKALLAARNGELVDKLAARNRPQLYGFTAASSSCRCCRHRCGSICTSWQPTAATQPRWLPARGARQEPQCRGRRLVILSDGRRNAGRRRRDRGAPSTSARCR